MYATHGTETLKGTVENVQFHTPRSYLYVTAPDANGRMDRWAVEWASGTDLRQDHLNIATLRPGDRVVITAYPARNPAVHTVELIKIGGRADGWGWRNMTPGAVVPNLLSD